MIVFRYATGTQTFRVFQSGSPFVAGITMVDPRAARKKPPSATSESQHVVRPARLANLPGNVYVKWMVKWFNGVGGEKVITAVGASTFTITDTCGASGSDPSGPASEISVEVVIDDDRNNQVIVQTNVNTPQLISRAFSCGP